MDATLNHYHPWGAITHVFTHSAPHSDIPPRLLPPHTRPCPVPTHQSFPQHPSLNKLPGVPLTSASFTRNMVEGHDDMESGCSPAGPSELWVSLGVRSSKAGLNTVLNFWLEPDWPSGTAMLDLSIGVVSVPANMRRWNSDRCRPLRLVTCLTVV